MVTQVTSFGRNGLSDWIVQRISGLVAGAYTLFIIGYLLAHPQIDYAKWSHLFSQTWVQIFTLMTLLSVCAHAWIGMWTIGTDYLRPHTAGKRADPLRFIYQMLSVLVLMSYLIWGIQILWGN